MAGLEVMVWWENVDGVERCDGVHCEGFCGVYGCRGGVWVKLGGTGIGGFMGAGGGYGGGVWAYWGCGAAWVKVGVNGCRGGV